MAKVILKPPPEPVPFHWGKQDVVNINFILPGTFDDSMAEALWRIEQWGYILPPSGRMGRS